MAMTIAELDEWIDTTRGHKYVHIRTEHKEAAVAYLASLWFTDVSYKVVGAKA